MEYLDIYDENGIFLRKEDRKIVHRDALWHKTVHCWLYDKEGNIYFQIRKEEKQLYTTASGHVQAGETVKEGFGREVKEEIGINVNYNEATLVDIVKFVLDRPSKDGGMFRDRAFANVYVCEFDNNYDEFNFDENEIDGLVKVNAKETLELLEKESGEIYCERIIKKDNHNIGIPSTVSFEEFLVNNGETAIGKYGDVLKKVIEITEK